MSWKTRRASIVLLALFVAFSAFWLDTGHAQDKAAPAQIIEKKMVDAPEAPGVAADKSMNPDGFVNSGIHLAKDEKGRGKQIEAAIDYINDGEWATATERLQKLLEIDEDVFVRLERTNAEGKKTYVWVSAKQEADRLVSTLPAAGADFYKATYGGRAADLLKKAKKNGDPALLAEVMKKYAHTDAGGEAIRLLADYHLDRGNYIAALLCYSKLLSRQGADKLPPEILAKAWTAARMSPASASANTVPGGQTLSAAELWKRLREQTRELKFGEDTIRLEDFEEYVGKLERPGFDQNATDSIVFRATPSRSNQLVGGPAFLSRLWATPLFYEGGSETGGADVARKRVEDALAVLKEKHQAIIPAFSPISITVRKGEDKKPLLIYKNYFGVTALNLRDGSLEWVSPSMWSLQKMLASSGGTQKLQAVSEWLTYYHAQHPQIVFENSTVNTLSTDGQYVYVVEDLAIPPTQQANFNPGVPGGANAYSSDVQEAIAHSKLLALSLAKTGALSWELGGEEKGPLSDSYFLGPPLPLAGKLYLLTEKQQEIRLVCVDPSTTIPDNHGREIPKPTVLSTQTLGMTTEKMQTDAIRRATAAHLAYGEGILVCPTNAGAVFGVNLLENSLIWAYPYRDKSDTHEQPQAINGRFRGGQWPPPGWMVGPTGQLIPVGPPQNQWKSSAPVISDGKVVFTAPDARSIHCINLRDGSPVWKKSKSDEDLYLGNVYNGKVLIVGKKSVRGLDLASGETLWTLETGLPSGQGIGSDSIYYLPLQKAGKEGEPQIAAIDLDRGKIVGTTKSRKRPVARDDEKGKSEFEVPGNLLFYEGKVISITADEVVAYPQLKIKIAEMDDRIAKNPNDPIGLTERGDLRLDKGDLPGAIDDLTTALKHNPDKATRERARGKLYDTLTAYIADHFNDAERYLQDYEDLCKVEIPEDAPATKRADLQAEERRRRATFLWLVGKGREEQGRLVEAFEKYQEFGAKAGKQSELVPAVDDRQVKAAPDIWSRGRIIAMMKNATPENREPLEKLISSKWDKLRQTNDLNELRGFVRMFGSVSSAGKEARLELVERLMEQKDSGDEHPLLEAELELNQFRTDHSSPELAARATEALARLYTRKGLLEDAAYCYRKVGKEYAGLTIRDGKTGRQIYDDDAATDKRLIPYLDDPQPLGSVHKFGFDKRNGEFPPPDNGQLFQFEHSGEPLPFFRHHIVGLNFANHHFTLRDRNLEDEQNQPKEVWSVKVTDTMFRMLSAQVLGQQQMNVNLAMGGAVPVGGGMMGNNNGSTSGHQWTRFCYSTVGHLIVLPLGHRVFGIDPVSRRVLWEKNLAEGSKGTFSTDARNPYGPAGRVGQLLVDPIDGTALVAYTDSWSQRLGQVSPFEGQTICVQSQDELSALDPLTGRVLWSRKIQNTRNYLFSEAEYVFLVDMDNENQPQSTQVFRALDGMRVKTPDFAALFAKRLQVFGRYLLLTQAGPANGVVLRLYDIVAGKDVWTQSFAARSVVARSEDATLTGVVEPDGKVHVIDLRARKEILTGEMTEPAERLKGVQAFTLLADRRHFYFASQTAAGQNANAAAMQMGIANGPSAVMTQLGMRTVPVSGYLHSFERDTGDLAWDSHVKPPQYLILDQFQDSPLVFLAGRSADAANVAAMPGMAVRGGLQEVYVTAIHKRSGTAAFAEKLPPSTTNFFGVRMDRRTNTVELLSQRFKVVFAPREDKNTKPAADATTPRTAEPVRKASDARPQRPAVERALIQEIAVPIRSR